jgi:asparagine synthase (glutamine-hydrolysing)
MKHRGPDDDNSFSSEHVAFAHNRLTVIDKRNGKQPMTVTYREKTYTLVYNGELYNTEELRHELKRNGITLGGHSDTEALIYTYVLFGEDTPNRLNGIFSFAVYNHTDKHLFICRDRLGVKPLYYAIKNGALIFASEIKGMLEHPEIRSQVDEKGLWQLLFLAPNLPEGSGVFKDISEMKPGECGIYTRGGLKLWKYWSPTAAEWRGTREEAIEQVGFLTQDAIRRQLVSDVPLCSLLSGGLDSSIVSSVAAAEYKKWETAIHLFL